MVVAPSNQCDGSGCKYNHCTLTHYKGINKDSVTKVLKTYLWCVSLSEFDLRTFLCSESEQLIWKSEGLPSDDLSMENALVILQVRKIDFFFFFFSRCLVICLFFLPWSLYYMLKSQVVISIHCNRLPHQHYCISVKNWTPIIHMSSTYLYCACVLFFFFFTIAASRSVNSNYRYVHISSVIRVTQTIVVCRSLCLFYCTFSVFIVLYSPFLM